MISRPITFDAIDVGFLCLEENECIRCRESYRQSQSFAIATLDITRYHYCHLCDASTFVLKLQLTLGRPRGLWFTLRSHNSYTLHSWYTHAP